MRLFLVLMMTLILPFSSALADVAVGDALPHSLTLKDQTGAERSFDSYVGEKGVVVVFVRSADWCPYCQVQLLDLRDEGQAITDLGYSLVSVSYDAPEKLKAFADKYKFPYTMLSDEGSEAIKAFGILSEKYDPDHFAYGVPDPHVYVVNNEGLVQAVLNEDGYKDRPEIEAITEAIQGGVQ